MAPRTHAPVRLAVGATEALRTAAAPLAGARLLASAPVQARAAAEGRGGGDGVVPGRRLGRSVDAE